MIHFCSRIAPVLLIFLSIISFESYGQCSDGQTAINFSYKTFSGTMTGCDGGSVNYVIERSGTYAESWPNTINQYALSVSSGTGAERAVVKFKFSKPIVLKRMVVNELGAKGYKDLLAMSGHLTTDGNRVNVPLNIVHAQPAGASFTISGQTLTGSSPETYTAASRAVVSTTNKIDELILVYGSGSTSGSYVRITIDAPQFCCVQPCTLTNTAGPSLSQSVASNVCPKTTVDLLALTSGSTVPANTSVVWYNDNSLTQLTSNPDRVGTGTYYAVFQSNKDDKCRSKLPSQGAVNVNIPNPACPTCGAGWQAPILQSN